MKSMEYIQWEDLKNIPFCECQIKEDSANKDIDIFYKGRLVLHDYNHTGHYLEAAVQIFNRVPYLAAKWVNLANLWKLRNCIRENYNHLLGMESIIFGDSFDGENWNSIEPLKQKDFISVCKAISSADPYATI